MNTPKVTKNIWLGTLVSICLTCDFHSSDSTSHLRKDKKLDIHQTINPPHEKYTERWATTKHAVDNTVYDVINILDTIHRKDKDTNDIQSLDNHVLNSSNTLIDSTTTISKWMYRDTITTNISSDINFLSQSQCDNLLDIQITKIITNIIPDDSKDVKFNLSYMRWEAYSLFAHFFTIEDTEDWTHIIFSKIQKNDKIFVTQHMNNMKNHIKYDNDNGFLVKLLLTKWDLKDYILNGSKKHKKGEKSNIEKLYEIITNDWSLKYKLDKNQFKQDIESIINLY